MMNSRLEGSIDDFIFIESPKVTLPFKKAERGTHVKLVTVHRGGKVFQRKQRVGRKEKDKVSYKSSHDFIKNEIKLNIDMREGEKFTTDPLMGEQIIISDNKGNKLDVWIKETPNMIQLSTIGAHEKGTGIGTKYLLGLKDYADVSHKKLVIPNMTPDGKKYFSRFDWLKSDHIKLEWIENGKHQEYYPENTMSYDPKEKEVKKSSLHPDNVQNVRDLNESGIDGLVGGIHEAETYIVQFKDGSQAIHKTMLAGDIVGEIGTYETSKILDWDIVPETIQCDYGKGEGSCQKWIPDSSEPTDDFIDGVDLGEKHLNDLSKIFIMDMILGNYDRHNGNIIIDKNDHVWAIDNEMWGKKANADLHIESLENYAKSGESFPVPMMNVLENSFGNDISKYKNFKDHVDKNIDVMLNKKDEIIKYWSQYENSDIKAGGAVPVNEAINYIKRNIKYLKDYRKMK